MKRPIHNMLASALDAKAHCEAHNPEWYARWTERIADLMEEMPSGSGFDAGTSLDEERTRENRLVFHTSFHHMTEHGYYDGWTEHDVIVTPSFIHGIDIRVTGINRNDIKDYIAETFEYALTQEVTW